jgi:hypothetical protein
MAVLTKVHIFTSDAEQYTEDMSFYVTPSNFGSGVDLPSTTLITNVISAIFAATVKPSTSFVTGYSVEVIEKLDATLGGNGTVATSIAAKTRNGIGLAGPIDRLMEKTGVELRIPGFNKASSSYDIVNPSSIIVTGTTWAAVRTALAAIGMQAEDGTDISASTIEAANVFNGKRAPKRPR